MDFGAEDHRFMAQALRLARRGLYTTTPNPRVGCVIVREGAVLATGWHQRAGGPHAEVAALADLRGASAQGATAYVTLEPCSHHGRTPPCVDALIAARVGRVVAAMEDPNPQVAGSGLARLRDADIATDCGLMEAQARELNVGFVSRMTRGRPWVRVKMAASLDGKSALNNGASQWITGEAARADGHRWRARACAILTGIGTVLADDPRLTVRGVDYGAGPARQPLRVVVDSRLRIGLAARLLQGGNVIVAGALADDAKTVDLASRGAEVLLLPDPEASGRVDLLALMSELGRRGINEVHVEAGPKLAAALVEQGLADELLVYLAPTLIGNLARGMFDLSELSDLGQQHRLALTDLRRVGADIRVIARPISNTQAS